MARVGRVTFKLYLITDRTAVRSGSLLETCAAALKIAPRGTVALQLREKDLDARSLYQLACELREIAHRAGAAILVNGRLDVALAANADGVHLPSDAIAASDARKLLGPDRLIGISTHSESEVAAATRESIADFAVFGPVYDPLSKSGYGPAHGPAELFRACRAGDLPVYALGGITPERTRELFADPASQHLAGVATIGAILGSDSPADAMQSILSALSIPMKE